MDFLALAQQCAPATHPATLAAIVRTESGFNPFAIGVVGGRLERQPRNLDEAVATARMLLSAGWNASFGLGQVNKVNLAKHGLDVSSVFDPCQNLRAASAIFSDNFRRARPKAADEQHALQLALSEYYSGNYKTGFEHGYVQKVMANAAQPIPVVPSRGTVPRQSQEAPRAQPALAAKGSRGGESPARAPAETTGSEVTPARSPAFVFGATRATTGEGAQESPFMFSPPPNRQRAPLSGAH